MRTTEQEFVPLDRVHVACDTGVMWEIFKNNAPWLADFERMAQSGVVFSLADHAFVEIVNQLDQGEFTDAQYVAGITGMARFIDPDFPVLPGKRELLEWCSATPDEEQLSEDRLRGRAMWERMRTAKSIADFEKGVAVQRRDGSLYKMQLTRGDAARELANERQRWIAHIDKQRLGWRTKPLPDRLAELAGELDTDLQCVPPLTVRLDAALRHEDAIIGLRSDANNPLNPHSEGRRNDGIDYNMSYVFMKRVLLCSAERKYPTAIRGLQSYQSGWIYRPDELVAAWKAGQLVRPAWP